MKKIIVALLTILFVSTQGYSQVQDASGSIKGSIIGFLKWYKSKTADTSKIFYSFIKPKSSAISSKDRVDMENVEKYLSMLRTSNFLSETYLNNKRQYFINTDKDLETGPRLEGIVKIGDLDSDMVLQSYEPETILDKIEKGIFKKIVTLSDKAIVNFFIPDNATPLLFTLTKTKGHWQIDEIAYYNL